MSPFWEFQIAFSGWAQTLGDWLLVPMQFFTSLGNESFYLVALPAFYWCIDNRFGIRIGIMLMLSNYFGNFFKTIFHLPRPYWISSEVQPMLHENSFGFPSGHSTSGASMWGLAIHRIKQKWLKWLFVGVIFLIGFSRIYLGVHTITDVLSGWLLGFTLLMVFLKAEKSIVPWFTQKDFKGQFFWNLFFNILLILAAISSQALVKNLWQLPAEWGTMAAAHFDLDYFNPLELDYVFTVTGVLFGLILGISLLKHLNIKHSVQGSLKHKIFRYIFGVIILAAIWDGLKIIFPYGSDLIGFTFRFIRYGLMGFWVSAGAPLLFIRFGWSGEMEK